MHVTRERRQKIEKKIKEIVKNEFVAIKWEGEEKNQLWVNGSELAVLRLVAKYKFNSNLNYGENDDNFWFSMEV